MKKRYVVFDLDSTLVCSNEKFHLLEEIKNYRNKDKNFLYDRVHHFNYIEKTTEIPMWTLLRPYIREFICYCLIYFDEIIIWSAGQKNYVDSIRDILFIGKKPLLTYTYDNTVIKNNSIHKPLSYIFNSEHNVDKSINEKNTLVIDDRFDTFLFNPSNGILIPKFEPDSLDKAKHDDVSLLQLMGWLSTKEVLNCEDYRTIDKTKIFETSLEEYYNQLEKEKQQ